MPKTVKNVRKNGTNKLQTTTSSLMASRPDWIKDGDLRGTEGITKEDTNMPRLALAQATSKQLVPTDPKYIDGLKFGQLFNSLTGDIMGTGPLEFSIIRRDGKRGIEYKPMEDGGGVIDLNVPIGDPRLDFTRDPESGASIKPIATLYYDFLIILWPTREVIALSFKSSGLTVARSLNGLVQMRTAPLFSGKYVIEAHSHTDAKGTYAVYTVQNYGWLSKDEAAFAEPLFEGMKEKVVKIDREREPGEDDEAFPTDIGAGDGVTGM